MDLLERTILVAIGVGIGFVLGYITSQLRKIEEDEAEVLDILRQKDERGSLKRPSSSMIGLFVVVLISFWAAIQSSQASEDAEDTVICVVEYNTAQGEALEGRDGAVRDATESEIDLWNSYEELYTIAVKQPKREDELSKRLFSDIISHRDKLVEIQKTRETNPYPDPEIVKTCKEQP